MRYTMTRATWAITILVFTALFAVPAVTWSAVSDFTSISATPTVTGPLNVDLAVVANTSGYWASASGDRVYLFGSISTDHWHTFSLTFVGRSAPQTFSHTFSFTLPHEGQYRYYAAAWYYLSSAGSIFPYYYTSTWGQFTTAAPVPALGGWGMMFLGALLATVGVFVLRRSA